MKSKQAVYVLMTYGHWWMVRPGTNELVERRPLCPMFGNSPGTASAMAEAKGYHVGATGYGIRGGTERECERIIDEMRTPA